MSGHCLKYNRGMTLVELLVVLSIFAIISMTVAFNYSSYKSTTSTNVLAQDVALSIREAQGYAAASPADNHVAGSEPRSKHKTVTAAPRAVLS